MPRLKLTDRTIRSLKPSERGQVDYFDVSLPGFGVRVSLGGEKAFVVLYRHERRFRRLTIGRYPQLSLKEARKTAKAHQHAVATGDDPAAKKREEREAETFKELAKVYLDLHASKKRSRDEDERIINKELIRKLGGMKATSIKSREIRDLVDGIAERGSGIMANRTLALVRKIFNFAIQREIVTQNPCSGVARPAEERQRERVLSEDEIKAVWKACDGEPAWVAAAMRLYLLTAQRKNEILGMRWDEVDLNSGWWTIPSERAKNSRSHRVPLGPQTLLILKQLRLRSGGSPFVFPSGRGDAPLVTIQKPVDRIRTATGIDFHVHDLRRTAASHMAGMGIARLTISKILNHVEKGVTAVYDRHSYDPEKREALLRWESQLLQIVSEREAEPAQALS